MFGWIKKITTPKVKLFSGGVGYCEVIDSFDRVLSRLYYNRPTSDMMLEYMYSMQKIFDEKTQLKEIISEKNKALKAHEIIWREISMPFAEKIFNRSEGYTDEEQNPIDSLEKEAQFEYLKKYHAHNLVDMVGHAFHRDEIVKKKS